MALSTSQSESPTGSDRIGAGRCELSVVMPCLNEVETVGICVAKARRWIESNGLNAEVIVADNGSTDGSQKIAEENGAIVVPVPEKGYGGALMGGIAASRGDYIIMGDADDSYDFSVLGPFVERLRQGYGLVQGCRLPGAGGEIKPGAMPVLHRIVGNPFFSLLARIWFKAPIHDIYCGLRGFSRQCYERLGLKCVGMAFATEMVIKASLFRERISEVPITLHPDGRVTRRPHLKTFRDGWRTLRLFLMYAPRWLFLVPGGVLIGLGLLAYALALPGIAIFGAQLDAHTLLFGSLSLLCGANAIWFAAATKVFAISEGMLPEDPRLTRFLSVVNVERGLVASAIGLIAGLALLGFAVLEWRSTGFGRLDYSHTMRLVIPGATLAALSFQLILSIFFLGILDMHKK